MKIEKEGVITGFQGGINIYVDKGHSMKVFKSLNQLTYGELKVGDSYPLFLNLLHIRLIQI